MSLTPLLTTLAECVSKSFTPSLTLKETPIVTFNLDQKTEQTEKGKMMKLEIAMVMSLLMGPR